MAVTHPEHWSIIGNGGATRQGPTRTTLATTPPLATYFVTVCAGPWASVTGEHDGIPLGVHARRSLEPYLTAQADHLLRDDADLLRPLPLALRHPVPVR